MNYLFFILLAFIDPGKIGKVNTEKAEAKEAYERGEYKEAITHYKTLTESLGVTEEEVSMNLAHSYFHLNDTTGAMHEYLPLTSSKNPAFRSVANQQLGVMANRQGKIEEALNYFKNSLKADPTNEEAAFNYEMVKKKLEEKKKQEEQQKKDDQKNDKNSKDKKDKDKKDSKDSKDQKDKNDQQKKEEQEKKDKEEKEKKDKEQKGKESKEEQKKNEDQKDKDKKDIPPSVSEKLKEMKMSEDKARMVLEAMKNQEVQYLQQNKRKATKPKSKGKPDW